MLPTHALVWSRNEFACRNCERRGRSDEANEELVNEALAKSKFKATLGLEVTEAGRRAGEWHAVRAREVLGEGLRAAVRDTGRSELDSERTREAGRGRRNRTTVSD